MSSPMTCSFELFKSDMCLSLIDRTVLGFSFELLLFLVAFVGLALAAEHLCNSMETLCDHWDISEDVGGATFIALGGAIPEITINCVSTLKSAGSTTGSSASIADLGVGAILGSGMIAYLLIPSLSSLLAGDEKMIIRQKSLFRDAAFYGVALLVLMSSLFFGMSVFHAPILVGIYVIYVFTLIFSHRFNFWWSHAIGHPHLTMRSLSNTPPIPSPSVFREKYTDDSTLLPLLSTEIVFDEKIVDQQTVTVGTNFGLVGDVLYNLGGTLIKPLQWILDYTCPDCRIFQPNEKLYLLTFVTSFAWITFFSFLVTTIVQRWVELLAMPASSAMFGLILVAAGAEVPDTVNAVTIARRGFGGMATSACLGSQVVNICLGLGMPWLIASIVGRSIAMSRTNGFIHEASGLLFIDVVILVIIVGTIGPFHRGGRAEINKAKALGLIAWYALTIGYLGYVTLRT